MNIIAFCLFGIPLFGFLNLWTWYTEIHGVVCSMEYINLLISKVRSAMGRIWGRWTWQLDHNNYGNNILYTAVVALKFKTEQLCQTIKHYCSTQIYNSRCSQILLMNNYCPRVYICNNCALKLLFSNIVVLLRNVPFSWSFKANIVNCTS